MPVNPVLRPFRTPRRAAARFLMVAVGAIVLSLAATAPVLAAGLTFVPDASLADVHPVRADLSVLTYAVPGGLLVADRTAPGRSSRFGETFDRVWPTSEFYLLQGKCHPHTAAETLSDLGDLAVVHWQSGEVLVIEVDPARAAAFAALDLNRSRIPLDAPPPGWDRRRGEPVVPPSLRTDKDAALVADFVANLSQPAFFQTIQEISGNAYFYFNGLKSVSTRYYSTADKTLVADYLAAKLAGFGYDVVFQDFTSGSVPCRNIIATRTGTVSPDEYVIVGGHYDSISQNPTVTAPGAEDNGSGTAAVVEIARIAANREFERSVQFVLFDSEEQGLYGSYHFVDEATTSGQDIIAAITMDMVAWHDTHYAVRIEGQTPWEWLMSIMEQKVETLTEIGNQKDYLSWGSDHVPFQQAGIPAFLAIDYDYGSYPGYHRTTDTWSVIAGTAAIGTQIATACAATLAEVAVLQPEATGVGDLPANGPIRLTAFPNPFNPRVTIAFTADRDGPGEVAVYDVTGRRLAVLARGEFSAGLNRLVWDGRDAGGRAVASGTYFCRLVTGDVSSSVAVNLVR